MTTSGTSSFSYNRDQIIRAAGRRVGAFSAGEIPDAQTVQDFSDALNAMVKHWEGIGIHVWTETEATLFTQIGQVSYIFGDAVVTSNATATYVSTVAAADANSGATSITVDSIVGISDNDYFGIALDDGTLFWTTVNGTPSGSTINFDDALTDTVSSQNDIYAYTTKIVRPLRIPFARRYNLPSQIITPMYIMSRSDYYNLPNPLNQGVPTQYYYSPQLNYGEMKIWPAPSDVTNAIKFTWYRPVQDFDTASDTPDLPQEWISTIIDNLAVEMAPEFGMPIEQYKILESRAASKLVLMATWDREPEPVNFGVDFMRMGM